jgi:hypothetical protein
MTTRDIITARKRLDRVIAGKPHKGDVGELQIFMDRVQIKFLKPLTGRKGK